MIYYLRNNKNRTILDCEVFTKEGHPEISSSVIIDTYSEYLLSYIGYHDLQTAIIQEFSRLSQLRSWLWEKAEFEGITDIKQVHEAVKTDIQAVAERLPDLHFVTD